MLDRALPDSHSPLIRTTAWSALRAWEMNVARRSDMARARVAVACKLAVILYRMWRWQRVSPGRAGHGVRGSRMTRGFPVPARLGRCFVVPEETMGEAISLKVRSRRAACPEGREKD